MAGLVPLAVTGTRGAQRVLCPVSGPLSGHARPKLGHGGGRARRPHRGRHRPDSVWKAPRDVSRTSTNRFDRWSAPKGAVRWCVLIRTRRPGDERFIVAPRRDSATACHRARSGHFGGRRSGGAGGGDPLTDLLTSCLLRHTPPRPVRTEGALDSPTEMLALTEASRELPSRWRIGRPPRCARREPTRRNLPQGGPLVRDRPAGAALDTVTSERTPWRMGGRRPRDARPAGASGAPGAR